MSSDIYTILEIQKIITPIVKDCHVKKVFLLGDYAKGSATCISDIDLLIDKGEFSFLKPLSVLHIELEYALKRKVNLHTTDNINKYISNTKNAHKILVFEDISSD